MLKSILPKFIKLLTDRSGEFALQSALMFGAFAVVCALLAVPMLDKASREYAQQKSLGIDPITTASTPSSTSLGQGKGRTYIKRKSVLSPNEQIICVTAAGQTC